MRTRPLQGAVALAALVIMSSAGCAADASKPPVKEPIAAFREAPCNLGEYWDDDDRVKRADYSPPSVDGSVTTDYGSTIANDRCSDAEILKWQDLRRAANEDDSICRIVWYVDVLAAVSYDIGCAVPLVVTHASR